MGSFTANSASQRLSPPAPRPLRPGGFQKVVLFRGFVCAQRPVPLLDRAGGDGADPKQTRRRLHSPALCWDAAAVCSPIHGSSTARCGLGLGVWGFFFFVIFRLHAFSLIYLFFLRNCKGIAEGLMPGMLQNPL